MTTEAEEGAEFDEGRETSIISFFSSLISGFTWGISPKPEVRGEGFGCCWWKEVIRQEEQQIPSLTIRHDFAQNIGHLFKDRLKIEVNHLLGC